MKNVGPTRRDENLHKYHSRKGGGSDRCARNKFQEMITKRVEGVLESVGQRTQRICKELNSEIQRAQLHIK